MQFVVMMHECSPGESSLLAMARATFMHHSTPSGVYQPYWVGMMHSCSSGELVARAAFMHHGDKGITHQITMRPLKG